MYLALEMESHDTVIKIPQRKTVFISKSYDPMEFVSNYNLNSVGDNYESNKSIKMHHPIRDKEDIRHSMLAYTNYVVQRQRRNQIFNNERRISLANAAEKTRRHSSEVNQHLRINATHIPPKSTSKQIVHFDLEPINGVINENQPCVVLGRSRIPIPDIKSDNVEGYLTRGNTFPPATDGEAESKHLPLTIGVSLTRNYDCRLSNGTNSSTKQYSKTRKLGIQKHKKTVQAWGTSSHTNIVETPAMVPGDLLVMGTRPIKQNIPLKLTIGQKLEPAKFGLDEESVYHNSHSENVVRNHYTSEQNGEYMNEDSDSDDMDDDDYDECDYFEEESTAAKETQKLNYVRKGPSEETLKNAIATLKMMEKQLEPNVLNSRGGNTNTKVVNRKEKVSESTEMGDNDSVHVNKEDIGKLKIRIKKGKRLKMPKQKLDIIPELDCEHSFSSDDNNTSSKNLNMLKIRKAKKYRLDLIEESSDEESDAYEELNTFPNIHDGLNLNGYYSSKTKQEFINVPTDSFIDDYETTSSTTTTTTTRNKAKLDIKNKVKKKRNKLFYIEQGL